MSIHLSLDALYAIRRLAQCVCLLLLAAPALANPVLDWNGLFLDAIRADSSAPTLASRNLAILNAAIYDAVNSVEPTHQKYRFQLQAAPGASTEAAAVGAAFGVSVLLYPEHRAQFDQAYSAFLSRSAEPGIADGLDLGRQIAGMAVENRAADGSSTLVPYIPSDVPGQWRRTPPFFRPPLDPQWGFLEPFCVEDVEPYVPPPPPPLASPAYAADFNEVKALGGKLSAARTTEQSIIAQFWSDFSYTEMPPGHWTDIAAGIVKSRGTSLAETARLFALLSLAQADAAIVVWRAKYRYNSWRPITAINRADEDGNPATDKDEAWQSFLTTPPFPEHVSGHSAFSMASAIVIGRFYGTDALPFDVRSDGLPGVTRHYESLTLCAAEIGMSRIYGGIHFPSANRDGKACGARIGDWISQNYLLANDDLPLVRVESQATGTHRFRVQGHPGKTCILETSTDLKDWQPISTNTVEVGGSVLALDPPSSFPMRFFRVREP